jgi:hypothetical protein
MNLNQENKDRINIKGRFLTLDILTFSISLDLLKIVKGKWWSNVNLLMKKFIMKNSLILKFKQKLRLRVK